MLLIEWMAFITLFATRDPRIKNPTSPVQARWDFFVSHQSTNRRLGRQPHLLRRKGFVGRAHRIIGGASAPAYGCARALPAVSPRSKLTFEKQFPVAAVN